MQAKTVIADMLRFLRAKRRTMLAVLAVMLLVQTALPAHEETHPLGSQHLHCEFCLMAGHAVGMPSAALPVPTAPVYADFEPAKPAEFHVLPLPRTLFSRGPPSNPLV